MPLMQIDFETGTIVTPDWLDRMQQVNTGLSWNAELQWATATQVSIVAGTGNAAACLNINGKMRFVTATINHTVTGSLGTKAIWATTTNDDSAAGFSIVQTDNPTTPTAPHFRLLGLVTWSGTAITNLTRVSPTQVKHGWTHSLANDALPAASIGTSQLVNAAVTREKIQTSLQNAFVPTGTVLFTAGATAPDGFLLANGAAVSRATYADLFTVIGVTHGAGDGSTTFNLPDTRSKAVIGAGQGPSLTNRVLGSSVGAETHVLTIAELASHTHTQNSHNHTQNAHNHGASGSSVSAGNHGHGVSDPGHSHGLPANVNTHNGTVGIPAGAYAAVNVWGSIIGNTNGAGTGITIATGGAHTHTISVSTTNTTPTNNAATATNNNTGSGAAHNNMQPSLALTGIIKT